MHKMYKCNTCMHECDSVSKYISHCNFHRNVPNVVFDCPNKTCNEKFNNISSLKSHISRSHARVETVSVADQGNFATSCRNKIPDFQCTRLECSALSFSSYALFMRHIKGHLLVKEEILCPFPNCSHVFRMKSSFTSHISRKHKAQHDQYQLPNSNICMESNMETDEVVSSVGFQCEQDFNTNNNAGGTLSDIFEFDFQDYKESEKYFTENLALFYLKLHGKFLLPSSTVQSIIMEFNECHLSSQHILIGKVISKLLDLKVSSEIIEQIKFEMYTSDLFSNLNQGAFKTSAKRASFFRKNFKICEPVEVYLGLDNDQKPRSYQYISICQSIASLYQHYSTHFQFFNVERTCEKLLYDVKDGTVFRRKTLFSEEKSFAVILYQDAFEVVNPLGSARKKHKLVGVYYTLANFATEKRSNIDHMQLVLLCKEKDVHFFTMNTIFERLISDLEILEKEGITVNGETIKGSLICIAGDNLGSHSLGGFQESFTSHYFCRYCEFSRTEYQSLSVKLPLRTLHDYKTCISDEHAGPVKGIKFDSIFNKLSNFHVCDPGLPPCLGHDLFEGVASFDMALIIKYFIKLKWFTLEQLNHRISTWCYKGYDALDKPAVVGINAEKLSGHAVQNWVLVRLFSLLVRSFVKDSNDHVWKMYLNLKNIIEILTSTKVSSSDIAYVSICIEEYIFDRERLFPEHSLKPKHHFLLHYPELTLAFGPLIHLWTLRFESKHSYFKRCSRQLQNFKHIAKTLAHRHQFLQAYYTHGSLFKNPLFVNDSPTKLNINLYETSIRKIIQESILTENACVTGRVTFRNTEYKLGCNVVMAENEDENLIEIQKTMPGEKEEVYNFLYKCLDTSTVDINIVLDKITELGVENMEDLKFLQEADLTFLKPVHLRKFLAKIREMKVGVTSSEDSCDTSSKKETQSPGPLLSPVSCISLDVQAVFSRMPETKVDIDKKKRFNPDVRRKFVREVVEDVRKVSTNVGKKDFEVIAQNIVSLYPGTFEDRIGEVRIGTGYDSLMKQLICRNENLDRSSTPCRTKLNLQTHSNRQQAGNQQTTSTKRRPNTTDTYGCINWGPIITHEEIDQQEAMRKELVEMYKVKDTEDWDRIYADMKSSYALLRMQINNGTPLEELLNKWPYLLQVNVLLQHCELLLGMNVLETFDDAYRKKAPILLRFFKSRQTTLGTSTYMISLENEKTQDNLQAVLQGVVLCTQKCLGEEEASLMFPVNEMASNEEIESSNTENWPRLAMLGANSLAAKEFALVVDQKVIGRYPSYLTALTLLFCVYYMFNIEYPNKAAATLEFIQRSFVGINPERGAKVNKKKRTSSVNSKVLTLINQLADFQWIE